MKKLIFILLFLILPVITSNADVKVTTTFIKDITLSLKAGQRIIVIDSDCERVYTKVLPASKRLFDYVVPEGKVLTGKFFEK